MYVCVYTDRYIHILSSTLSIFLFSINSEPSISHAIFLTFYLARNLTSYLSCTLAVFVKILLTLCRACVWVHVVHVCRSWSGARHAVPVCACPDRSEPPKRVWVCTWPGSCGAFGSVSAPRLPTCGIISLELAMRLGASKVATSWHKKEDSERKEGKEAREGKMEGKGRKEGVAVLKR